MRPSSNIASWRIAPCPSSVCVSSLTPTQERNVPNCSKLASRLPCWPVSTSKVKSRGQNFTRSIHRCLLVVCAIGEYDSRSVFSLSFSSTSLLFSALLYFSRFSPFVSSSFYLPFLFLLLSLPILRTHPLLTPDPSDIYSA